MDLDLRWVAALCYPQQRHRGSGVAAAVLNHPAGVAWLANKLAPFGVALGPGEFVLGGSFTATVEAHAATVPRRLRVIQYDHLPLRLTPCLSI